jgi:hypothetical protein
MLYRKLVAALRRLEIFLVMPTLYMASPTFADQPKKEVHSQADLPRISYPLKGSISTLLQADDSVFDAATSQVVADIDSLLANYDIRDNATLISILGAKLAAQELKGDITGGLQTISKLRELQSKPDDEKRTLELVKEKRTTAKTGEEMEANGGS